MCYMQVKSSHCHSCSLSHWPYVINLVSHLLTNSFAIATRSIRFLVHMKNGEMIEASLSHVSSVCTSLIQTTKARKASLSFCAIACMMHGTVSNRRTKEVSTSWGILKYANDGIHSVEVGCSECVLRNLYQSSAMASWVHKMLPFSSDNCLTCAIIHFRLTDRL